LLSLAADTVFFILEVGKLPKANSINRIQRVPSRTFPMEGKTSTEKPSDKADSAVTIQRILVHNNNNSSNNSNSNTDFSKTDATRYR